MTISPVVASNFSVLSILSAWRSTLAAGSTLRLFQSATVLDPANNWGSFTEASFTGYAPFDLTHQFSVPVNPVDGNYTTATPVVIFECTGGSPQTIYGAAIVDASLNLWYSVLFDAPIVFTPSTSYSVQMTLDEWAASTIA